MSTPTNSRKVGQQPSSPVHIPQSPAVGVVSSPISGTSSFHRSGQRHFHTTPSRSHSQQPSLQHETTATPKQTNMVIRTYDLASSEFNSSELRELGLIPDSEAPPSSAHPHPHPHHPPTSAVTVTIPPVTPVSVATQTMPQHSRVDTATEIESLIAAESQRRPSRPNEHQAASEANAAVNASDQKPNMSVLIRSDSAGSVFLPTDFRSMDNASHSPVPVPNAIPTRVAIHRSARSKHRWNSSIGSEISLRQAANSVHTPSGSVFDGQLPTVPSIQLPDVSPDPPAPTYHARPSAHTHTSIDLTANNAVPSLAHANAIVIPSSSFNANDSTAAFPASSGTGGGTPLVHSFKSSPLVETRTAFSSAKSKSPPSYTSSRNAKVAQLEEPIENTGRTSPLHTEAASASQYVIDRSWWWNVLTLAFLNPILETGFKRALEAADIPTLSAEDETAIVVDTVQKRWNSYVIDAGGTGGSGRTVPKVTHPLLRTLASCYYNRFFYGAIATAFGRWSLILTPFFTKEFLTWIPASSTDTGKAAGFLFEFGSGSLNYGLAIILILFVLLTLNSLSVNHAYYQGVRMGCALRTALMSLIYEKSLRCSSFAKIETTAAVAVKGAGKGDSTAPAQVGGTGQTVNLMANDTQQIFDACNFFHFTYVEPLLIVGTVIALYFEIGVAAFPAGGLMLLLLPIQIWVARRIGRNRATMVRFTDQRVKVLSEILQGIRIIKYLALEQAFANKIQQVREKELVCVRKALLMKAFNLVTLFIWPVFVSMVTFIVYVALGNDLTVSRSVEILAFVNVLARPITVLPTSLISVAEVNVSLNRIEKYLLGEELQREPKRRSILKNSTKANGAEPPSPQMLVHALPSPQSPISSSKSFSPSASSASVALEVKDGTFAFDRASLSTPALSHLTFSIPHGKLIGVIGSVGSGKTSLFNALLGELVKIGGSVRVNGNVAYMAQQAWIQNNTVRNNILFGLPYDEDRYNRVIEASCLKPDLELLPNGSATEIGEKGITMSGGQKSRITMARCLYRYLQTDIFLLDDPFAAVDVGTGSAMFHGGVEGMLVGKTRVVVLNSHLHLLKFFDQIFVMGNEAANVSVGGGIIGMGTYDEIEAKFPLLFAQDKVHMQSSALGDGTLNEIKEEGFEDGDNSDRARNGSIIARAPSDRNGKPAPELFLPTSTGVEKHGEIHLPTSIDGEAHLTNEHLHHHPSSSNLELQSVISHHQFRMPGSEHIPTTATTASPARNRGVQLHMSRMAAHHAHQNSSSQNWTNLDRKDTFGTSGGGNTPLASTKHLMDTISNYPFVAPKYSNANTVHNRNVSESVAPLQRGPTFSVVMLQSKRQHDGSNAVADISHTTNGSDASQNPLSPASTKKQLPSPIVDGKKNGDKKEPASLMTKEDRATGSVGFQLYRYYFDNATDKKIISLDDIDLSRVPKPDTRRDLASITASTVNGNGNGTIGGGVRGAKLTRTSTLAAKPFRSSMEFHLNKSENDLANGSRTPSSKQPSEQLAAALEKQQAIVALAEAEAELAAEETPDPALITTPSPAAAAVNDAAGTPVIDVEKAPAFKSKTLRGLILFLSFLTLFVVCQALRVGCDLWLTRWGQEQAGIIKAKAALLPHESHPLSYWSIGCVIVTCAALIFVLFRAWSFIHVALKVSNRVHQTIFIKLLQAPVTTFFDTTPLGRVLNRMSKDMDQLDNFLPDLLAGFIQHSFNLLGGLIVSVASAYYFLAVLAPIFFIFYRVQRFFRISSRELKRIEGVTRSPIFSMFGETLLGLATIRAFASENSFISDQRKHIQENSKIYAAFYLTSRWLAMRLDLLSNFLVLGVGLFGVFLRNSLDESLVGLALIYTLQFAGFLQFCIRLSVDTENSMTSVERLSHYEQLPSEAAYVVPEEQRPPENWPARGEIQLRALKFRYRPELPYVLRGITLNIHAKEKIGIVGRTGSGKSSLLVALFRMVETSPGSIFIDGVDISTIGLHDLRSNISIINQESVLFSGTIRANLDPNGKYSDAELWKALEQVSLKPTIEAMPHHLDSAVAEYGDNYSQGQKQLLCIARALLRKSKVIVLDEATAAVDTQTDALIQQTIRTNFADATVLTIAHRLHTILDSSRVLVLDKGCVAEFDTPQNLLMQPTSIFAQMVAIHSHHKPNNNSNSSKA